MDSNSKVECWCLQETASTTTSSAVPILGTITKTEIGSITVKLEQQQTSAFSAVPHDLQWYIKENTDLNASRAGRYQCSLCPKVFREQRDIRSHLVTEHNLDQLKVRCHLCSCSFSRQDSLIRHRKMKHNIRVLSSHQPSVTVAQLQSIEHISPHNFSQDTSAQSKD